MQMKTLLITDAGGRGAALVDKYGQSNQVGKILVVPGNDLMQINTTKEVITYPQLKTTSISEILEIIKKEKVDLVDVAQDNAVEAGVADEVFATGVLAFGSSKLSGQIEWDKAWARDFMKKYDIPSPLFYKFNNQEDGINFAKENPNKRWFIKAAGLAEGKGVIPGVNLDETINAINSMAKFGKSGETYLLEEWLEGEEFSAFALCDGKDFVYIGSAQDHKRVFDGDTGPNTGGMGCVSNPLIVTEDIKVQINEIFTKAMEGMKKEKRPYKGVLYLGGMVVQGRVYVIEFNARWGDPEAEVILPSIKNDWYEVCNAVISGNLKSINLEIDKKVRVVVAVCSKGYPESYTEVKGKKITGIEEAARTAKVYGAGIRKSGKDFVVNGGRVLFLMAEGEDILEAREKVYSAISLINIDGNNMHFRKDIGWRDLERWSKARAAH